MPFQATAFRLFCDHNFTDRNKYKNEIAAICLENPGLDRRVRNGKISFECGKMFFEYGKISFECGKMFFEMEKSLSN